MSGNRSALNRPFLYSLGAGDPSTQINANEAVAVMAWHLGEIFVKVRGKTHYLRRAVDYEGGWNRFSRESCDVSFPAHEESSEISLI
jgi:hypothetical protein